MRTRFCVAGIDHRHNTPYLVLFGPDTVSLVYHKRSNFNYVKNFLAAGLARSNPLMKRKKDRLSSVFFIGGESGIRTLGTFRHTTFRVSHLRPLGQLSNHYFVRRFYVFGEIPAKDLCHLGNAINIPQISGKIERFFSHPVSKYGILKVVILEKVRNFKFESEMEPDVCGGGFGRVDDKKWRSNAGQEGIRPTK